MLSLFLNICLALFAEIIILLLNLLLLSDIELSAYLGLNLNQFSSINIILEALFPSLDMILFYDKEKVSLSQQVSLNFDSIASALFSASQDNLNPDCNNMPKEKRDIKEANTFCLAYLVNLKLPKTI